MNPIFRNWLRRQAWVRPARLARRNYIARNRGHPDWRVLLERDADRWQRCLRAVRNGPRILIPTSVGGNLAVTPIESLLAIALTLRGADVEFLLCDSSLPACMACESDWYPDLEIFLEHGPRNDLCSSCFAPAERLFREMGFRVRRYSDLLDPSDRERTRERAAQIPLEEIDSLRVGGIRIGEHARAGTLRFFARGDLGREPQGERVLRRYLHAALLTQLVSDRLLRDSQYEIAVFHHGIYVPQGIIGEVARIHKVRVVNWHPASRKQRFLFSHDDTYHRTLISEPIESWEKMRWSDELESETLRYLESRWTGEEDWISFQNHSVRDPKALVSLGVDPGKPCIGLLTNVIWDAQLHYTANAFPDMLSWLDTTVDYFSRRPDLQLLIRVHPAEILGGLPSRQSVVEELARRFPTLPKNVIVIGPENRLSTFTAMSRCDSVLIYGTKAGIELVSLGIPVITAGEAFIRNKGLSIDASNKDDYLIVLDRLPLGRRLDRETLQRARRYAFHFFFRRMIPLEFMEPTGGSPPYRIGIQALAELEPGRSLGLDVICDGILMGAEFIYPAESTKIRQVSSAVRSQV